MKYRFSSKAKFEINSIWLYTYENWSLEQAEGYYDQLIAEIEQISKHPEDGRVFARAGKTFMYTPAGSHLIFYRVNSEMEIEVMRILHKRMDIENRLRD